MRISNAQKYADKILNFVKELAKSDNAIYGKTKDKLTAIGELCSEIQQVISDTLETSRPRGFDPNTVEKTDRQITVLDKRVDVIEAKIENLCSDENKVSKMVVPKLSTKPNTIKTSTSYPQSNETKKPFIAPTDAKKALHTYAVVLENTANADHDNAVLNRCCNVMWHWFDTRFLNRPKAHNFYKFNVADIRKYITGMVVSFGYHIESGDFEKYADRIEDWINKDNKHIYPYEVKLICEDKESKYANTTAMLLWNALYNLGYSNLEKDTPSNSRMFAKVEYMVYRLINDLEERAGDSKGIYTSKYKSIADTPNILWQYNIR